MTSNFGILYTNDFNRSQSFSTCWTFLFRAIYLFILVSKNPVYRDLNSRPNVSEGYEITSELPGRPAPAFNGPQNFIFVPPVKFLCPCQSHPDAQKFARFLGVGNRAQNFSTPLPKEILDSQAVTSIIAVKYLCVCVCVCFLPTRSGHQVRWTTSRGYTGGRSHRRKVTRDFPSTFLLRYVPSFFYSAIPFPRRP